MQYAVEPLSPEFMHEADAIFADYYENTVAKDGIPPFRHNWPVYAALGDVVHLTTVRDDADLLAGFAIYFLQPHLHHPQLSMAYCDTIAVAWQCRGKGLGKELYRFTEPLLVQKGVQRVVNGYRVVYGKKPMFEELGFKLEEHVYVKEVS